jgi:hypothetical protein
VFSTISPRFSRKRGNYEEDWVQDGKGTRNRKVAEKERGEKGQKI